MTTQQATILLRHGGDEMQVTFDHQWQAQTFERLFRLLLEHIEHAIPRDKRSEFQCETTLQYQLAREKSAELEQILRLDQLGFWSENRLTLMPKPTVVAHIGRLASA